MCLIGMLTVLLLDVGVGKTSGTHVFLKLKVCEYYQNFVDIPNKC